MEIPDCIVVIFVYKKKIVRTIGKYNNIMFLQCFVYLFHNYNKWVRLDQQAYQYQSILLQQKN